MCFFLLCFVFGDVIVERIIFIRFFFRLYMIVYTNHAISSNISHLRDKLDINGILYLIVSSILNKFTYRFGLITHPRRLHGI